MRHIRRVVTGFSDGGESTVLFDDTPANTIEPLPGLIFSDIWEDNPSLLSKAASVDTVDRQIRLEPQPSGSIFKMVTFPPVSTFNDEDWKGVYEKIGASSESNDGGSFHKTTTIDYVIVLSGEIYCVLEEGEVLLRAGDVLVQQGTNHSWQNRSDQPATIIGVMIDRHFQGAV